MFVSFSALLGAVLWPVLLALFHLAGPVPQTLGPIDGHLAGCGSPAHCVREDWPLADPAAALEQLMPLLATWPGLAIEQGSGPYLQATATSRFFGFVDDLELLADPKAGVLQVRSESRLGDSDLGVNRQRLDRLRQALDHA